MEQHILTVSLIKHASPSSRTPELVYPDINTSDIIVLVGHVAGNCQQSGPA
jgi:hypothetical protein